MILRKYQHNAIKSANQALDKFNNTICVAPTGAGKTIMLSALIGERIKKEKKVLVLQHRDELTQQNQDKFSKVNPNLQTSIVDGSQKDFSKEVVFAMVQTLSRQNNLDNVGFIDLLVIDESHHSAAPSYQKIIDTILLNNPNCKVIGFTATPNRGDGKGLKKVFNNCCYQIEVSSLIREGYLVEPKCFVIDVGVKDQISNVKKTINDYDMGDVEKIMNKKVINERVVEEWIDKASDRKTIVFCSTISHAMDLLEEFKKNGIGCAIVTGDTQSDMRKKILYHLEYGELQVVVNVAVLTEGFDAPPVSCVVLTRPCSFKSTMTQMIGRGLRLVDNQVHPKIIKKDCIVLDFGCSILNHGSIDETIDLEGQEVLANGVAPEKNCPECGSLLPINVRECPVCGYVFISERNADISDFEMTEVTLMDRSPFRWIDLSGTNSLLSASGFKGFSLVTTVKNLSFAIVKKKDSKPIIVSVGTKKQAIACADDFLRQVETNSSAKKSKEWLNDPLTEKQKFHLLRHGFKINVLDMNWNKYRGACWLNYLFNKKEIDKIMIERLSCET